MNILTRKVSGVYEIVNTVNGHKYIGSASDIKHRWENHRWQLRKGTHHSVYFQRAWDKYGEDCFKFYVIEYCDVSLLLEREQYYIDQCKPAYNTAKKREEKKRAGR